MRNLHRPLIGAFFATCAASAAAAQVQYGGEPAGPRVPDLEPIPTAPVPAPDVNALLLQEAAEQEIGPLRYGEVVPLPLDFVEAARWSVTRDLEYRVGRLRIEAPGAYSLAVEFERYELPRGARLFVYDDDLSTVYGAYTQANRIPTGEFVFEPFPGDSLVLEYSQPTTVRAEPEIVLRGVIYDYKNIFEIERGLNLPQGGGDVDGGCTVNVNCPVGDPYELQKRATVRTLYGGGLCSGSMINNTDNDGTQYLYTANHCGTGSTVIVRFNYQTETCSGGTAPTGDNVSGAVVLDSDVDTDGRLLRITNVIPFNYNPYYSGWSRSSANLTFGMSMHHPGGGPKNISIDNNGGFAGTSNFIGIGSVKVWFMNFHVGGTSGGSSGGPLFDEGLFIRGTLTGGPGGICNNSQYGRFHNFWNESTIGNFLDPSGSGVTSVTGFDPNDVIPVIGSISPAQIEAFSPSNVTLTGEGFFAAQSIDFGTEELVPPFGFIINDPNTITIFPPTPTALGSVDVTINAVSGSSNTVSTEWVETSQPQLGGSTLAIGGMPYTWSFGGGTNDLYYLIVALNDGTTIDVGGVPVLANLQVIASGALSSDVGFGSATLNIPPGLSLQSFFSEVVTFDDQTAQLKGSNITSTLIL